MNRGTNMNIVPDPSLVGRGYFDFCIEYTPAEQFVSATHIGIQLDKWGKIRAGAGKFLSKWHPSECLGEEFQFMSEGWVVLEGGK